MSSIGIGLAGFGTVGTGVWKNLQRNGELMRSRVGASFEVKRIAVRDLSKKRASTAPASLFTSDWKELVRDPDVKIVVELMGGIDQAKELTLAALRHGKTVVTGNKALLAEHGREIFHLAREMQVPIFYEAAVAGGIPIIKAVREAFVGNQFESIQGILNGTSNYILTRMEETGMDFLPALQEAQSLGYAEADPALDVNGWDAAHKAIILASLAYGRWLDPANVFVRGIEEVTAEDIGFANQLGYRVKLLATICCRKDQSIEVRVCPTLIPKQHVLASVGNVFNAVWLKGDVVGEALFYGRGAGQDPTASSVLGDLAEAALALQAPPHCYGFTAFDLYGECVPVEDTVSSFYLRLLVEDRPGVLARIAGVLGDGGIGISSVIQPGRHQEGVLPLVLMLHNAPYGKVCEALETMRTLDCLKGLPMVMHVESFE
jgi:homoserine dehydrogenase